MWSAGGDCGRESFICGIRNSGDDDANWRCVWHPSCTHDVNRSGTWIFGTGQRQWPGLHLQMGPHCAIGRCLAGRTCSMYCAIHASGSTEEGTNVVGSMLYSLLSYHVLCYGMPPSSMCHNSSSSCVLGHGTCKSSNKKKEAQGPCSDAKVWYHMCKSSGKRPNINRV